MPVSAFDFHFLGSITLLVPLPYLFRCLMFCIAVVVAGCGVYSRVTLAEGGSASGSTLTATVQPTEKMAPQSGALSTVKSIWYTWTPTYSGSVTISTLGSSFDTVLGLYTGSELGTLRSVRNCNHTAIAPQSHRNNTAITPKSHHNHTTIAPQIAPQSHRECHYDAVFPCHVGRVGS